MNRGSVSQTRSACQLASSFNEAPIHESGKLSRSASSDSRSRRFNEAPIHESGKSGSGR